MTRPELFERLIVLSRSDEGENRTPPRALAVSLLALFVAATAPFVEPASSTPGHGLLWILALVPCFLLSFYRGWRGAALSVALGMAAIAVAEVAGPLLLERSVDWWIVGVATVLLITLAAGTGIVTELLQRSGGDPHLADRQWRTGRQLQRALRRNEFVLHYQPVVDLGTGDVCGAEAVLRWEHPEVGTLPPDLFLPTAEATGLIRSIGRSVVERACRDLAAWRSRFETPDRAGEPFWLSVNLSPVQCRDAATLEETVVVPMRTAGVPVDRLQFELPEETLLQASPGLRELHDMGATVVIDDFGTENASLTNLQWVEVGGLKIHETFTSEMLSNPRSREVVRSVIQLGERLGMVVTAEGVETTAQAKALREMGCDRGQGFLFGPPLPLEEALERTAPRQFDPPASVTRVS